MIKVGEPAPDFTLVAHDGGSLSLTSLRGAKVLLWFFVEANTPGCTLEGRGFRDHQSYFDENNIRVVGVSFDSPEDNAAFARRHDFGFPLLSDANHAVAIAYGACSGSNARYPDRVSFLDRRKRHRSSAYTTRSILATIRPVYWPTFLASDRCRLLR